MVVASAITTAAFVIVFVGLGLGVLLLAFSGGTSGGRSTRSRPNRSGRRAALIAIGVVCLAFGIGLPALGIAVNSNNQSKGAPGGVDLTASQQDGRRLFARRCGTCHTLRASNSVGKVGPNIDRLRPPKALTLDAIANGRARGAGQMPSSLIDGQDAEDVADFLVASAGH